MSQDMLGVVVDIVTKLHNGSISLDEAKRFARREEPFVASTFDLAAFMSPGWEMVGNRKPIPAWNPAMLKGVSALNNGEEIISGYESKNRLKDESLLGVEAFWLCWNNTDQIPSELKGKMILFDGEELRSPSGHPCSLYLMWDKGGWGCGEVPLSFVRDSRHLSACGS
jgi:hypothetical protein